MCVCAKCLALQTEPTRSINQDTDSANKDLFSKTHAVGASEKADFPKGASIKLSHSKITIHSEHMRHLNGAAAGITQNRLDAVCSPPAIRKCRRRRTAPAPLLLRAPTQRRAVPPVSSHLPVHAVRRGLQIKRPPFRSAAPAASSLAHGQPIAACVYRREGGWVEGRRGEGG